MLFHCGELLRLHRWFSHSVSKCHPLFKQHNLFFLLEAFKANSSSLLSFLFGGNLYKNNNIKTGSWKYTKVYWNIRCFTSYSIKAIKREWEECSLAASLGKCTRSSGSVPGSDPQRIHTTAKTNGVLSMTTVFALRHFCSRQAKYILWQHIKYSFILWQNTY